MKSKVLASLILSVCLLSVVCVEDAAAQPFYEGKTIKLIVGFKPGGGTDFYARLLARYMLKYLPGANIVVKNTPGAGSMIALNRIYLSKPDGLTFGAFSRGLPVSQLVGVKGVKFDMSKVSWLGSPSSEIYGLYVLAQKYNNVDDIVKADKVRLATTGIGALNYTTSLLFFRMLGLDNFSIGTGYSGNELGMVILRGEMDASFGSFATYQTMIDSGELRPLLFISNSKPPGYESVPYIQEVITGEKNKLAIDFLVGLNVIGRPFVGPPGIPQDRLKIIRDAFKNAINDPESKKLAKKANKPLEYVPPETAEAWVKGIFKLPPEVVSMLKEAYGVK